MGLKELIINETKGTESCCIGTKKVEEALKQDPAYNRGKIQASYENREGPVPIVLVDQWPEKEVMNIQKVVDAYNAYDKGQGPDRTPEPRSADCIQGAALYGHLIILEPGTVTRFTLRGIEYYIALINTGHPPRCTALFVDYSIEWFGQSFVKLVQHLVNSIRFS